MENTTDDRTRQMLGRAQEASSSLVHVMEDLLKLTKVEDVSPQQDDKFFNLSLTGTANSECEIKCWLSLVSRVLKALQKEAQRKSLDLTVLIHESLPTMVKGDGDRLKQVLAYLAGNAFKQSTSAVFEINTIRTKDMTSVIGINIQDSSPGMSESELDVGKSSTACYTLLTYFLGHLPGIRASSRRRRLALRDGSPHPRCK